MTRSSLESAQFFFTYCYESLKLYLHERSRTTAANDSLKSNRFSIEIRDLLQSYVGRMYIFLLALGGKASASIHRK